MKEIVIMAGTRDSEKRLLPVLTSLFPECTVRIVYAGNDREENRIRVQTPGKEMGTSLRKRTMTC